MGTFPFAAQPATDDWAHPSALAAAVCPLKYLMTSFGVMPSIIGMPIFLSIALPIANCGRLQPSLPCLFPLGAYYDDKHARTTHSHAQEGQGHDAVRTCQTIGIEPANNLRSRTRGTNDVGAATMLRVAAALETNTTWLMTGRGDPDEILPTGDAADLLALYAQLSPDNQRAILAAAAALRNSQEPQPPRS